MARFVVQRHEARNLHYDFRLEIDGVFKSWALPKGPPLTVGERRLAIMTADHDLSFGEFAGSIPEGEYGAGSITIWDHGEFTTQDSPGDALAQEALHFTLHGQHLKGRFQLLKPHHAAWRGRKETREWLLINEGPAS
jgi:bifunctional non-homologous end joining protein LigD